MTDQKPWYHEEEWGCFESKFHRTDTYFNWIVTKEKHTNYHGALGYSSESKLGHPFKCFTEREAKLIASAPETARERDELREALTGLLERYVSLINCGDCGHWDPETEDEVIAARAALARSQ